MRVALVTGSLESRLDGVAAYVARLTAELRAAGVEVEPVVAAGREPGSAGTVAAVAAAARRIRALRPDAVHVQFAPSLYRFRSAIGALPLLLPRGLPLITTLHEYGGWRSPAARLLGPHPRAFEAQRLADRETLLLVPRSAAVITTNAAHAAEVDRRFDARVPARTIPIGANVHASPTGDREAVRREVRAELGLASDAVLIVFFGFVHPVKGVRYLADALALLGAAHRGRPLHALVAGGFESMALPADEAQAFERELRAHVAATGVEQRMTITGFLDEPAISRLLHASDFGVLPFTAGVTAKSGSLLALLAHGLPTAVTRSDPAEPELVDGRTCVHIARVRDGAAVADALRRLLDDDALSARVASGGRALAASRSWDAIAAQHATAYDEVLAR